MCSPTRNGLVKMIVRPATTLLSTPCNAKPSPRPATPMPATSGAIWKPNLSRATTTANSRTTIRTTRTIRLRIGGPTDHRWSGRSVREPIHQASRTPTPRITRAPRT
jgi:hypothetical protein